MSKRRRNVTAPVWVLSGILMAGSGLLIGRSLLDTGDAARVPGPEASVQTGPSPVLVPPQRPAQAPAASPQPRDDATLTPKAVDAGGGLVLCAGRTAQAVKPDADGTLLGHRPYAEAPSSALTEAPPGFASGSCRTMHREARAALDAMLEAARAEDPALAGAMVGLSCFRSEQYQKEVFCRKVGNGLAARARSSAPPGYSEHATGYAIDFGDRNAPGCNLATCFADTDVGRWLDANARAYGFVLSFPQGNDQGVMYEPWHWRYEAGSNASSVFAQAR